MQKIIAVLVILFLSNLSYAQKLKSKSADAELKEQIYNANKKIVINYSMKDFDALFFEFSDKKSDPNIILTKEEFYNYTIKIAAFSDRLAKLYPKEKEVAEASKKKWFAESYEDYLLSKASQKK
ncbi:MAG: hypothetical protein K2Y30_00085 [Flavobacteriaceae bacterium]|jgi:hypothetical protein|uniref:Uncharacterized protein n=1 Tax=Flavobacterium kayseriense TaxID=2764714 RepID=A0ABR7J680_9FLAO|nr:hypothetical protein [Flavobacterium kayseriense]MBC5840849.1 hypothetical protein [Flavobacterium kayseriense]MBC5846482.1 hypothetical protein [Flavobacterium kayseriense]MBU0940969.1 hypothetical protein [Bacteroidota bacterium]MBX9886315.1 hypothetical protein [Flavobacteriaceae bacterium]